MQPNSPQANEEGGVTDNAANQDQCESNEPRVPLKGGGPGIGDEMASA